MLPLENNNIRNSEWHLALQKQLFWYKPLEKQVFIYL